MVKKGEKMYTLPVQRPPKVKKAVMCGPKRRPKGRLENELQGKLSPSEKQLLDPTIAFLAAFDAWRNAYENIPNFNVATYKQLNTLDRLEAEMFRLRDNLGD
jgi:hypothetical protein